MCDSSLNSESTSYGFSASESYCTCITPGLTHDDFINAPAFHIFKEQLRRAAQCLTVAQFTELRRRYENVWLEVLEEL